MAIKIFKNVNLNLNGQLASFLFLKNKTSILKSGKKGRELIAGSKKAPDMKSNKKRTD